MTTVTERRIVREADHGTCRSRSPPPDTDSNISGILKGGRLWKTSDSPQTSLSEADEPSDEVDKRSVRFYENQDGNRPAEQLDHSAQKAEIKDEVSGIPQQAQEAVPTASKNHIADEVRVEDASSPDCTELTLTFKLGQHHVLVANSLQRPNSAVRQLFPVPTNFLLHNRPISDEHPVSQDTAEGADGDKQTEAMVPGGQHQCVVTAESLKMFEEAKRAKLAEFYGACESPQGQHGSSQSLLVTSDTDDDTSRSQIRRTIERNILRRNLLRYDPGNKNRLRGGAAKTRAQENEEESLEERIRRLTCDLDDEENEQNEEASAVDEQMGENGEGYENDTAIPPRSSPQGEETRKPMPTDSSTKVIQEYVTSKSTADKATSPSSASVTSSSSTSSSTYKKLTDLFARRTNAAAADTTAHADWGGHADHHQHHHQGVPLDLGNGLPAPATSPGDQHKQGHFVGPKCAVSRASVTSEARKQFLSTLAPLAACVTSGSAHEDQEDAEGENGDDYYHQQVVVTSPLSVAIPGDRMSVASSSTMAGGEEYSLDDIDEVLAKEDQKSGAPQPDVVAGTPGGVGAEDTVPTTLSSSTPVDELALFVEQGAGRIERIKKRYNDTNNNDDDEHDDYGFNRRPSVRGIKPRFGSTTEILQQMQSQLQPPALLACPARSHVTWPYQEHPEQSSSPTGENCAVPRRRVPLGRGTAVMPPVQEELGPPYGNYNPTGILQAMSPTDRKDRRYMHQVMYPYQQQVSPSTTQQQIMRIGGGCAEYQQPGTRTPPIQHLQYPEASNSPPPPGISRNYTTPNDVITSVVPADGSTPPPGQYHHYPGGFQSLDRNASNLMTYGRRMTPPSGVVQMRISPVASATSPVGLHHHHQPPQGYTGSGVVKLSTFNDPSLTAIVDPHYSVMPHPQASSSSRSSPLTTSVIRVGHGQQQTIRVPYASGTPVQVHFLTRSGNESPQRGSPLLATRPQYVVARGTQTPALSGSIGSLYQVPPNARYYPNGAYMRQYLPQSAAQLSTSPQQGRGPMQYIPDSNSLPQALSPGSMPGARPYIGEGLKPPQSSAGGRAYPDTKQPNYSIGVKLATSPVPAAVVAAPVPFSAGSPTRTAATSGERGVPEGAASCSPSFPQDALYPQGQPPASSAPSSSSSSSTIPDNSAATTSVYYAMNV